MSARPGSARAGSFRRMRSPRRRSDPAAAERGAVADCRERHPTGAQRPAHAAVGARCRAMAGRMSGTVETMATAADAPAATHLQPQAHPALLPRAVSRGSGPSCTRDIRQTMVLGTHGPCRVQLIVMSA